MTDELRPLMERLAEPPTASTKHMSPDERFAGVRQMWSDLHRLAVADGCVAAAWALERLAAAPAPTPPDDADLATAEWLDSIGFDADAAGLEWWIEPKGEGLYVNWSATAGLYLTWCGKNAGYVTAEPTRGDVRRLLAALRWEGRS